MNVFVAGDFCPRERVTTILERWGEASIFSDFHSILHDVDFSIVNLECPIVVNNVKPIEKNGPTLSCLPHGIEAIKDAGFDCVTLANNHLLDLGKEGVAETLKMLDLKGVDHVGGGMNLVEAAQVFYKQISKKRLAVINCCEHEFSIATDQKAGSNPLNPIKQYYAIQEAKKQADRILVIVHGGHEHFQLPSLRMVETYRFFIDAGADAVVNHHQHCFSGYEVYKGKPIFYGLGNFCFDNSSHRSGLWTEGYAVMIVFSESDITFEIHPYRQCASDPKVVLLPSNSYDDKIAELNSIISNPELLQKANDEYYRSCAESYSNVFEPFYNRFYLAAKRRGLLPSLINKKRKLVASNFIQCESHRDKLVWWLNHEK